MKNILLISTSGRAAGAAVCRGLLVQPWEVIAFSSEDGTGRGQILELFDRVLDENREAAEQE